MEWLRWYHGACSDAKWPIIARKAGVSVGVVVSVWAALLENASQDEERGSVAGFDGETYDALYGYEDGTCDAVLEAMTEKGLICDGCICAWRKRQPDGEREERGKLSTERVRRFRERQRAASSKPSFNDDETHETHSETLCNADETHETHKNRTEQRREENTHTPKDDLNNLNTRAHALNISGREVCGGEGSSPEPEQATFRDRPKTDAPSKGHPQWPGFLSCWDVYPVKQGKEAAWREWMRLHEDGTLAPAYAIRESILRLNAEDSRWRRGMAPKMDKWLYGKGWEDEPYMPPGAEAVAAATVDEINAQAQRAAEERRKTFAALREESERMRYSGWTRQAATDAGGVQ